jgi:hypothetical protein
MTTIIEERQKNRWLMLRKVYERSDGRADMYNVNRYEVGKELGWDRDKTDTTYDYLQGEGLLTVRNVGSNIVLTHKGVKEVEQAESNPEKPTLHFPSHIINIYGDNIGRDKVMGDKIGTQNNNYTELAQASQDIKDLLNQLSATYPDDSSRVLAAKAIDNIDHNPDLKSRIIKGLKKGSLAALEKAIDHPVATFFVEGAKEAFK